MYELKTQQDEFRKNREDELYHYGVLGMKWGVRRYQNEDGTLTSLGKHAARVRRGHAGAGQYLTSKRQLAGNKRDLEYLNKGGHLSVGLTKKRQAAYDKRDKAILEKRIAKQERKNKIKEQTKKLNKQASFGETIMYNNATRKRAAKYIVDNNMSVSDATKKAKGEALRNTAIFVGAYAGVKLYSKLH